MCWEPEQPHWNPSSGLYVNAPTDHSTPLSTVKTRFANSVLGAAQVWKTSGNKLFESFHSRFGKCLYFVETPRAVTIFQPGMRVDAMWLNLPDRLSYVIGIEAPG